MIRSTYTPYSSQVLLIASFEDGHIETMTNTMRSSGYSCQSCPDGCNPRPAKASMRRWRGWGEELIK
jgi:hypothetical protein